MAETITWGTGGGGDRTTGPVLCVIGCAAPPVRDLGTVVRAASAQGWHPFVVLTPTAARWLSADLAELERLTGRPVRSEYTVPGDGSSASPRPDAVLVAPATANTLNKCAAGISDTLALGVLNQAIGSAAPIALAVGCGPQDQAHPAFAASAAILRGAGAEVLLPDEPEAVLLHAGGGVPVTGVLPRARTATPLRWREALAVLTRLSRGRHPTLGGPVRRPGGAR